LGKLRILSGRDVCQILANHNFIEVRQHGSHIAMQKRTSHLNRDVAIYFDCVGMDGAIRTTFAGKERK